MAKFTGKRLPGPRLVSQGSISKPKGLGKPRLHDQNPVGLVRYDPFKNARSV